MAAKSKAKTNKAKAGAKAPKLTERQRLFVEAYVNDPSNATKAALAAGYSEKTARFIGAENLTKPNIKKAITAGKKAKTTAEKKVNPRAKARAQELDQQAQVADNSKSKMGQPTLYSEEIAVEICRRLSIGTGIKQICQDASMPSRTTVYRWLNDEKYVDFRDMYKRSREECGHFYYDEMVAIADGAIGSEDSVDVAVAKLRIETRKLVASKLAPREYGDKKTIAHEGEIGQPPSVPTSLSTQQEAVLDAMFKEIEEARDGN